MQTPGCSLTTSTVAPECSRRLVLRECLELRAREAQFGVCDTGRYRCRYVVWGQGPTLVLIPGLASDSLSFVMLMARLRQQFRCISFDLPDGVADGAHVLAYHHEDFASDLLSLLDHLNIAECTVYGSSFGSTIALLALAREPHRFSRGVLQGGFAYRPLARAEVLAAAFGRYLPGRVGHLPLVRTILARKNQATFQERDPDVWEFFLERTFGVPLRAFASRVLMVHRMDLRPLLGSIHQPVLLVCGDRDPMVGKACEADLMRGLPRVARAEIEHCGHEPHLTHPEVLAEVLNTAWTESALARNS